MRDNAKSGALTEVTLFILLSLYEPRHGYAIMKFVEEQTGGRLILGAGSLYGALNSLEKKGLIRLLGEDTERRKQYRITAEGQRIVEGELARLRAVTQTAAAIVERYRPYREASVKISPDSGRAGAVISAGGEVAGI